MSHFCLVFNNICTEIVRKVLENILGSVGDLRIVSNKSTKVDLNFAIRQTWHVGRRERYSTAGLLWAPALTIVSHQNSATSPTLMDVNSTSHTSILNIFPTKISAGCLFLRLSSITVLSKLSSSVWKWKTNYIKREKDRKRKTADYERRGSLLFSSLLFPSYSVYHDTECTFLFQQSSLLKWLIVMCCPFKLCRDGGTLTEWEHTHTVELTAEWRRLMVALSWKMLCTISKPKARCLDKAKKKKTFKKSQIANKDQNWNSG